MMTVEAYDSQDGVEAGRRRKSCPPHGPHMVEAVEGGQYAARCLKCGLVGPLHQDASGAKLAFDQTLH
jgi:hypothetical protein